MQIGNPRHQLGKPLTRKVRQIPDLPARTFADFCHGLGGELSRKTMAMGSDNISTCFLEARNLGQSYFCH
jgi:hypothetical protein